MVSSRMIYKVGRSRGDRGLRSLLEKPLGLDYDADKEARGKYGPLFAFDSLDAAREFATFCRRFLFARTPLAIWEAGGVVIRPAQIVVRGEVDWNALPLAYPDTAGVVEKFWHKGQGGARMIPWPGTMLCE